MPLQRHAQYPSAATRADSSPKAAGGIFTFGTSNPVAGPWEGPSAAGFFAVQAVSGVACASVATDDGYPDCVARYTGSVGSNYRIKAWLYRDASLTLVGPSAEVELHLALQYTSEGTPTPSPRIRSVEWLVNYKGGGQVMEWNGDVNDGSGSFFVDQASAFISGGPAPSPGVLVANGATMEFQKVGNVGILIWNGSELGRLTLPRTAGGPGFAFFARAGMTPQLFGVTQVEVAAL